MFRAHLQYIALTFTLNELEETPPPRRAHPCKETSAARGERARNMQRQWNDVQLLVLADCSDNMLGGKALYTQPLRLCGSALSFMVIVSVQPAQHLHWSAGFTGYGTKVWRHNLWNCALAYILIRDHHSLGVSFSFSHWAVLPVEVAIRVLASSMDQQ